MVINFQLNIADANFLAEMIKRAGSYYDKHDYRAMFERSVEVLDSLNFAIREAQRVANQL